MLFSIDLSFFIVKNQQGVKHVVDLAIDLNSHVRVTSNDLVQPGGATIKVSDSRLKDLKGTLPSGTIKDFTISRIILRGNLIGGWAHSRDLIYVSSLFKAYNTEQKVFETLQLAEKAGINTMNVSVTQFPLINKYKRIFDSSLQTMSQVHPTKEDPFGDIDKAIAAGVDLVQIQGNCCDWRVRDGPRKSH